MNIFPSLLYLIHFLILIFPLTTNVKLFYSYVPRSSATKLHVLELFSFKYLILIYEQMLSFVLKRKISHGFRHIYFIHGYSFLIPCHFLYLFAYCNLLKIFQIMFINIIICMFQEK
jgi:hypothetical protein